MHAQLVMVQSTGYPSNSRVGLFGCLFGPVSCVEPEVNRWWQQVWRAVVEGSVGPIGSARRAPHLRWMEETEVMKGYNNDPIFTNRVPRDVLCYCERQSSEHKVSTAPSILIGHADNQADAMPHGELDLSLAFQAESVSICPSARIVWYSCIRRAC